jgi:hypothetical protein
MDFSKSKEKEKEEQHQHQQDQQQQQQQQLLPVMGEFQMLVHPGNSSRTTTGHGWNLGSLTQQMGSWKKAAAEGTKQQKEQVKKEEASLPIAAEFMSGKSNSSINTISTLSTSSLNNDTTNNSNNKNNNNNNNNNSQTQPNLAAAIADSEMQVEQAMMDLHMSDANEPSTSSSTSNSQNNSKRNTVLSNRISWGNWGASKSDKRMSAASGAGVGGNMGGGGGDAIVRKRNSAVSLNKSSNCTHANGEFCMQCIAG